MIDGVVITPLKQIPDERGKIMHMLRSTDPFFQSFGEIYFSCVYQGVIKGWHNHKRMILNYTVPFGKIKLVLFDDRKGTASFKQIQEIFLGPNNYCLVTIPPGIWNGFKGIGAGISIVANCASIPHDPDEILRKNPFDPSIPYSWEIKHG